MVATVFLTKVLLLPLLAAVWGAMTFYPAVRFGRMYDSVMARSWVRPTEDGSWRPLSGTERCGARAPSALGGGEGGLRASERATGGERERQRQRQTDRQADRGTDIQ